MICHKSKKRDTTRINAQVYMMTIIKSMTLQQYMYKIVEMRNQVVNIRILAS